MAIVRPRGQVGQPGPSHIFLSFLFFLSSFFAVCLQHLDEGKASAGSPLHPASPHRPTSSKHLVQEGFQRVGEWSWHRVVVYSTARVDRDFPNRKRRVPTCLVRGNLHDPPTAGAKHILHHASSTPSSSQHLSTCGASSELIASPVKTRPHVKKSLEKNNPEYRSWDYSRQPKFAQKCLNALRYQRKKRKEERKLTRQKDPAVLTLSFLCGPEKNKEQVEESLLKNHPEFCDWSVTKRQEFTDHCFEKLKIQRRHQGRGGPEAQARLLSCFPLPTSSNNEPYTLCSDGTEQSYREVKKKLSDAFTGFGKLAENMAHQIVFKCRENLQLQRKEREMPGKAHQDELNEPRASSSASSREDSSPARLLQDESTLEEVPPTQSLHSDISPSDLLPAESASEDSPQEVTRDTIAAHLEEPFGRIKMLMQSCAALEANAAEFKYRQKTAQLEAEVKEVTAENGLVKMEKSMLMAKAKDLTDRNIKMERQSRKSREKSASDAVLRESKSDDQNQGGANKSSESKSRKRAASEVSESAETSATHKKKKHKSSKKKAGKGVN
ncbi:hypothetical protein IWX90DRAFT_410821 [Phyllosticta citrichinensis]|uniref:Uncharacterized protein n=1 Tax=Phyllosticta citrichinensis TaxID=1130410 RepID=A0ABR1Y7G4_9PEZI